MVRGLQKLKSGALLNNTLQIFTINAVRAASNHWSNVPMGPPDVILGISEAYKKDTHEKKVNLGVGAYRDDDGKPWVLPSVKKAEDLVYKKHLNHEYAPISGNADYTLAVGKLVLGEDNSVFQDKSIASVQSLSGTGALRLGFEFVNKFYGGNKVIYMPKPTWGNHPQICNELKIKHEKYTYFDPKTVGFDLEGCISDIKKIPEGSVILMHACAHNPTGVDPKHDQWVELSKAVKSRNLLVFFDSAYQGFATGDVDNDAFAIRQFVKDGHQVILAQSFAKNMGLYGERTGAFHVLCGDQSTKDKVMSQLKIIVRVMYSNPPLYGSRLVTEILTNPDLKSMWLKDVKKMADRIISMREALRSGIEGAGNKQDWCHITDQIGMFCFTGLKPDQVARLTKEFHVYLTKDGRISVAGLSNKNVGYVAKAMHTVSS